MADATSGHPLAGDLVLLDPKDVLLWRERGSLPRLQVGRRVCYARGWENDSVRVGLQFADGQAARLGRTAHRQIVQAASRLKHATAPSLAGLS